MFAVENEGDKVGFYLHAQGVAHGAEGVAAVLEVGGEPVFIDTVAAETMELKVARSPAWASTRDFRRRGKAPDAFDSGIIVRRGIWRR